VNPKRDSVSHGTPVQPGETSNFRIRQNRTGDPPEQITVVLLISWMGVGGEAQQSPMEPPVLVMVVAWRSSSERVEKQAS